MSTDMHEHLLALTGMIEETGNWGVPDHLRIQHHPSAGITSAGACTKAEGACITWVPTRPALHAVSAWHSGGKTPLLALN